MNRPDGIVEVDIQMLSRIGEAGEEYWLGGHEMRWFMWNV
jgi:hypothetical protein